MRSELAEKPESDITFKNRMWKKSIRTHYTIKNSKNNIWQTMLQNLTKIQYNTYV